MSMGVSSPSTGTRRPMRPASWSASCATAPRATRGMARVALFGDPTRALGSLAEPECRRIIAALDRPSASVSARLVRTFGRREDRHGLRHREHGLDRRRAAADLEFTQAGGEINVVVTGINVGAQPYWNAEATMLMHTRGILVMTPASAMVLTGKQALDYSGAVSAEDNFGIGGYERIMGPNGQGQYWAHDLAAACRILLEHHEHAYVAPGERFPRRATRDPPDRDVRDAPTSPGRRWRVGDVSRARPTRPQAAVRHPQRDARGDRPRPRAARALGGHAGRGGGGRVGRPSRRLAGDAARDRVPSARSTRVHSRRRPRAVVLRHALPPLVKEGRARDQRRQRTPPGRRARQPGRLRRLAGVDARMAARVRRRDRASGGELRRTDRFCVISRYHGGAFVVFSQRLNEQLETVALEGTYASVIGGAPAAGVVFAREVEQSARRIRASPSWTPASRSPRVGAPGAAQQRTAVRAGRGREAGCAGGAVRGDPQRGARGAHGLGAADDRPRRAAALSDRRGRARDRAGSAPTQGTKR